MKREDYLHEAEKQITGRREQDYGKIENNFQVIADFWAIYTGIPFQPHDVAVMMALMKVARIQNGGGTGDSYVDAIGYLGCAGELRDLDRLRAEPISSEDIDKMIQSVSDEATGGYFCRDEQLRSTVKDAIEKIKEKYGDMTTPPDESMARQE